MIPHKATVATAQPVHFKVVYNSTGLAKDKIELSTYHLTYNYFNFSGPIKVPNACMYAKKLAEYAYDNKIYKPNENLSLNLHYL